MLCALVAAGLKKALLRVAQRILGEVEIAMLIRAGRPEGAIHSGERQVPRVLLIPRALGPFAILQ
jgi:hypothetical protein